MFSALLILLVALGFGLSLFLIILLFLNPKKYQNTIKDPTVIIVKIVELHRENLPVNSAHGWSLTPSNCNLRCWQKDLSLNIVGYPVSVYACAKEIPCAAVILLNVIADVSTWSEWDVQIQNQTVHLELPENPSLHGDPFMQCDQVLITSKLNTKPEIEMYRFGNLESNGTGWILLWNAKRLDWTLYVAQPIDDLSDKRRSRRRQKVRSDSMNAGFPRNKGKRRFISGFSVMHLDIENRRSSSLSAPIRRKPPELTVTQPEEDEKPPQRSSSHSFLHALFPRRHSSDSYQRSRSPSPSQSLSPRREKKGFFRFDKGSLSSQEDLSSRSSYQDMDLSDTNECDQNFFKMAHSAQDENIDFKALGEYSISAVLQENLKASLVDVNTPEEEQKRKSSGWVFKEINKNIAIFKKTMTFDSCVFVSYLCKGIIPTPLNVVWKTLCNPVTRFMYDDTLKKITVLNEYPDGQKLIHMYNESVTFLHKEVQDFCILQTEKIQGSKFLLGFHSVKDVVCPPVKDVVRGTVAASGWVVEPVKEDAGSCQVSYLVQMVVSSPEASTTMEEISSLQSQCINNLSIYLSAKPPSYLPVFS